MADRRITHTDLVRIGPDPESLAGLREFGRFRVLPPYRHASWALPVVVGVVIMAISLALPHPLVLPGLVLASAVMVVLMMTMMLDDRNSIRRDARAYVEHGIVPCILCGTGRAAREHEERCRGCGAGMDMDSLRVFWAMRANTVLFPKKDDPDVIKLYLRIHHLSLALAPVPSLVPVALMPLILLGRGNFPMIPTMLVAFGFSVIVAFSPVLLLARLQKSVRRKANGLDILFCPECMHDLRGLPSEGMCPECGRIYSAARVRAKWWLFDLRWILKHGRRVAEPGR